MADRSAHEALQIAIAGEGGGRRSLKQWAVESGYAMTEYANRRFGWLHHGVPAVRSLLATGRFHAILSTSPPETVHMVVARASGKRIPWIADFRDLWRRDHLWRSAPFRFLADSILERRALSGAVAITTVSEPYVRLLQKRYPGKTIVAVPNAFDAQEWVDVPFGREERCTIMYAGQLYGGRDPSLLFAAVRALLDRGAIAQADLRIDLYAAPDGRLRTLIDRYALEGVVQLRGTLPRREILRALRRADLLLVLLGDHPFEEGTYTGKIFEYLGARRPVLVSGGPQRSVLDDLLSRTRAGIRVCSALAMECAILAAIAAHRNGGPTPIDEGLVAPYESASLAHGFARVLDRALEAHRVAS